MKISLLALSSRYFKGNVACDTTENGGYCHSKKIYIQVEMFLGRVRRKDSIIF